MSSRDDLLPRMALVALCLVAFTLIIVVSTRLSFFNDDWYFLLQRPGMESHGGVDVLLAPHNGNLVIVVAALFKLLVAIFGMHQVWPFRVVSALSWATLGVVLYLYVRDRVGVRLAILAAALVLFLGPAWESMLFISGLNHAWAVTLGLGALMLLERDPPRRGAACALLTIGVGASNTALALCAGAALAIVARRRIRDLWVVAVPVALFGLWWVGYGRGASTGVTAGHIAALPGYVFDSLSSGLSTILGFKHGQLPSLLYTGRLVAVFVLVALSVWLARGGRPRLQALPVAGSLVVFWLLTGASAIPGRGAAASRYQVVDAVLILATAAELLHQRRPSPRATSVLALVTAAIIASNLLVLHDGYAFLRVESDFAAADTGALQLAGPRQAGDTWLVQSVAGDPYLSGITARRYFAQTTAHGTPAYDSPTELARAPLGPRTTADGVLIAAEHLQPRVLAATAPATACAAVAARPGARVSIDLSAGSNLIENRGRDVLVLFLSRFAPPARAHGVAFLATGTRMSLSIPADASLVPWSLTVQNPRPVAGMVAVCRG